MTKICTHCYISGRVQGVFYRAKAQQEARKLGLAGWVKNLADGRVEAMLCGEEDKVAKLISWMHHGPTGATVTEVKISNEQWQENFISFDILK